MERYGWTDFHGVVLGPVEVVAETDSTNAELLRRPRLRPGPTATVLVARHQTGGRGRRGRRWESGPGRSVLLSAGFEPPPAGLPLPCLPLLGTVAVTDVLDRLGLPNARCKWPNDVLLDGRKVAGVLVESVRGARGLRVVVGVGLNVAQSAAELPRDCPTPPTSLAVAGTAVSVAGAGVLLLEALDLRLVEARDRGPEPLIRDWLGRLLPAGDRVRLETPGGIREGRLRGFSPTGELLLERAGTVERVAGGHVLALHPGEADATGC